MSIFNFIQSTLAEREAACDAEIMKLAEGLEQKRQKAIEQLGDKWILKGGTYNRGNTILNQVSSR